jgi:hypothetical protein
MDRNEEWKRLIDELEDSLDVISRAFAPPAASICHSAQTDVEEGIRRGYCAFRNQRAIAETLDKQGLVKKWDEIATYAMRATSPSDGPQPITSQAAAGFGRHTVEFLTALRRASGDDSIAMHPLGSSSQR